MRGRPSVWAREMVAFLLIFVSLATNYVAYFVPFLIVGTYFVVQELCRTKYYR